MAGARRALDWPYAPFEIPGDLLTAWRAAGTRGAHARKIWDARLAATEPNARDAFKRALAKGEP